MASKAVMVKHPAEIIPTVSPGGMKLRSVIETPPNRTAKWDHYRSAHESDRTSTARWNVVPGDVDDM
jgi:hypothetical protein